MAMQVAVGHYDVRDGGQGVEVFVDQEAAINAVIDWVIEANLIGQSSFQMTEAQARDALRRGEGLSFDTRDCFYSVEMKDVQGVTSEGGGQQGDEQAGFDAAAMRKLADLLTPFACKALKECLEEADRLQGEAAFYKRRCDALQGWQSRMRDPERTVVCDILANGFTLPPANAGDRYDIKA